jgi:hypothetical protein
MMLRSLALGAAFCVLGSSFAVSVASAAELAVSPTHRSAHYYQTGFVLWDDVYPPAVYGPYLRPVEEVQALKAERRPVSAHFRGYWNGWDWYAR